MGFSCSIFPPCPCPAAREPLPWIQQNKTAGTNKQKKKHGHEMSTYGGFWARLEFFYLLGKTKLEKKKGEGDDGDEMKQKVGGKAAQGWGCGRSALFPGAFQKPGASTVTRTSPCPSSKGDSGVTQQQVAALAAFSMPTHRQQHHYHHDGFISSKTTSRTLSSDPGKVWLRNPTCCPVYPLF